LTQDIKLFASQMAIAGDARDMGLMPGSGRYPGGGWGTRVYLWRIHVDIWPNQLNIVKLKNKKIYKKINKF